MSKYRRAARIDDNQQSIVSALRDIPGVSVDAGHDDILVGFNGKTYWFEIKNPDVISPVTGRPNKSAIKESQQLLLDAWQGHYMIVWTLDQILSEIGVSG